MVLNRKDQTTKCGSVGGSGEKLKFGKWKVEIEVREN